MPASQLVWSPMRSAPIFPFYGQNALKRKAEQCQEPQPQFQDAPCSAKRRCQWQQDQEVQPEQGATAQPELQLFTTPTDETQAAMEINHNDVQITNNHLQVGQQWQPRVPSPWPSQDTVATAQAYQNTAHVNQRTQSVEGCGGIMELSDETYNMAASCASMDSDYVPDRQQYNTSECHSGSDEFCKQYCRAGNESPNSGRIRCFCKPSWEGMLDSRPYISDVY